MKTIRIAALLLTLSTLVAPFHHVANAANPTQVAATEPAATIDPGTTSDSRAGVAAAVLCGTMVGLYLDTKYPGFLGMAVGFCAFMVFDALTTPDY